MGIDRVKIGASVEIGSLRVRTPYIQSFNVTRSRGQVSSFNASLKVSSYQASGRIVGDSVEIYAGTSSGGGTRGSSRQIFSGICKKATVTPCFDDPYYVILNISGNDILSVLQGKKYTRRSSHQKTSWITIEGVSRKGLKSGKFKYKKEEVMIVTDSEIEEATALQKSISLTDTSSPHLKAARVPGGGQGTVVEGLTVSILAPEG